MVPDWLFSMVLWLHLFSAIVFIGGSFFIWFVVWPVSFDLSLSEKDRTMMVGKFSKRFALFTNLSVLVLIPTGLALAYFDFGLHPSLSDPAFEILLLKAATVVVALSLMYYNNLHHAKKIVKMIMEKKMDDVAKMRKTAHFISYVTLGLLILITVFAAMIQVYP
ncbi:MAG: hypothetical protein M1454_00140 [Candidatus Thermoplasmatota archaeon]|nr:hypothetical protein [Candidatus Thermoplasmatota archaeon]MCL5731055.1 hypothetical protein [Candidatus Thermoplasmatota archaeon]